MAGRSICFLNLKGGVGKSTLSTAFAEYLAFVRGEKVLFVDADPQCNSTTMLIGTEAARELDRNYRTLYDLVRKYLNNSRDVDINRYIEPSVSNIQKATSGSISLIPSTIRFADYEQLLLHYLAIRNLTLETVNHRVRIVIERLKQEALSQFDWVIVDTAPSFSLHVRLIVRLTRFAVIPTTPDPLSAHGAGFVVRRLKRYEAGIEPLCIVISKYRKQSELSRRYLEVLRQLNNPEAKGLFPPVLKTVVPESAILQRVADFQCYQTPPKSFDDKYGQKSKEIIRMSEEIVDLVKKA